MRFHDRWPQVALAALLLGATVSRAAAQESVQWMPFGTATASDMAVGADGAVWVLSAQPAFNPDKLISRWNGTTFDTVPGAASRISVDPSGQAWIVNSRGDLYRSTMAARRRSIQPGVDSSAAAGPSWKPYPLAAADVGVGANGTVWATGRDGSIYRLDGETFRRMPGAGVRVAVDPSGNAWVVNQSGQLYHWVGAAFQPVAIPVPARDVAVAPNGTVFLVATTKPVLGGGFDIYYSLQGDTFRKDPAAGMAVAAGPRSVFLVQDASQASRVLTRDFASATAHVIAPPLIAKFTITQFPTAPASTPTTVPVSAPGVPSGTPSPTSGALVVGAPQVSTQQPLTVLTYAAASAPDSGSLECPIISFGPSVGGPHVLKDCESHRSSALHVGGGRDAGPRECASIRAGVFFDPENGGECWTCPVSYIRNVTEVSGTDACWKPVGETLSAATRAGKANGMSCRGSAFFDPINGGTCWSCPATYRRTLNPVNGPSACALTIPTKYAEAKQVGGCSLLPTPVGYGTAFQHILGGGDCYACPVPLTSNWAQDQMDAGDACSSSSKTDHLIWKLTQYPEPGVYAFVPGLVEKAFANVQRVDALLGRLANGDASKKRELWSAMERDPGSSAAFKALLFNAMLTAAAETSPDAGSVGSLTQFANYYRARHTFIAQEATRMWNAWQPINEYNKQQALRRAGGTAMSPDVLGSAGPDFIAYAWAGAKPDSAGREFLSAAVTLGTAASSTVSSPSMSAQGEYTDLALEAMFKGLEKGLDKLGEAGTEAANAAKVAGGAAEMATNVARFAAGGAIALQIVATGIGIAEGIESVIEQNEVAEKYVHLVPDADRPASVHVMLAAHNPGVDRQLLLYWALATSPHAAGTTLGAGKLTSSQVCANASMNGACAEARSVVAAAAGRAGY